MENILEALELYNSYLIYVMIVILIILAIYIIKLIIRMNNIKKNAAYINKKLKKINTEIEIMKQKEAYASSVLNSTFDMYLKYQAITFIYKYFKDKDNRSTKKIKGFINLNKHLKTIIGKGII